MGQHTLLHGETLLVVPITDLDHITLPVFSQHQQQILCPYASRRKYEVFIHFNELLAASGWERNVQLHSEAVDSLKVLQ